MRVKEVEKKLHLFNGCRKELEEALLSDEAQDLEDSVYSSLFRAILSVEKIAPRTILNFVKNTIHDR